MQELLDDQMSEKDLFYEKRKKLVSNLLMVEVLMALMSTILAGFYEITSILMTGPIGSIYGLVVVGLARTINYRKGVGVGLSAPIFSLGCFLTILILSLGKDEAHLPITTALAIYTVVLVLVVFQREL